MNGSGRGASVLLTDLEKRFDRTNAVDGVSLDIRSGEFLTLLGPSGSGKTTTLMMIAGFETPTAGDIAIDAKSVVAMPPYRRNIGMVFQNYALFPHMTLRQNLEFAAERRPRLERHRRVNEMLERFRLGDAAGRRPHEVSGGQRQRCSIARALIGAPKLLLFDEPAQGLDAPLRAEFYEVLRQVRADFKTPMLLVTHSLDECFELGEEMLVLREGRLVQSGAPPAILDQPANVDVARLLGVFNLLPAEIRALDPGRNTSKVQMGEHELDGPYFPGRLKGDRVTVCVRPERLAALGRNGRLGANQIPAQLERTVEKPQWMRLEFAGGIAVDLARPDYERVRDTKDWVIEFPRESLRVL